MVTAKAHSIPYAAPCPTAHAHFKQIPWCAALYDDPSKKSIKTIGRVQTSNGANHLMSRTLATDNTIQAWQSFWSEPSTEYPRGQAIAIIYLAEGLGGHAKTLHGGFMSLLLDELMNYVGAAYLTPGKVSVTMELKTRYKRLVMLPGAVMVRTWVEERSQGRKLFIKGVVEDGAGNIYAEGDNMSLEVVLDPKAAKAKL